MRFQALATDYDGTIAHDGLVDNATINGLVRLKQSNRRLVLVTGRELPELREICLDLKLFDLVVAENGAVMFDPAQGEELVLAPTPSEKLADRLRASGVPNVSVGRSIIALWKPHEVTALKAIRDLGLDLHIVFNKDAVMILPSSINKFTGLNKALERLHLEPRNVVGVGDAENDQAFLLACGFSAAVSNAIGPVKESVMWVSQEARGAGVVDLIGHILDDDLAALQKLHADAVTQSRAAPNVTKEIEQ